MTDTDNNVAVWFEIPASDLDASQKFYETVLGIKMTRQDAGPNPIVMFAGSDYTGVSGHLYSGKPAASGTGPTVHLDASDGLEDALTRVPGAGGKVISDIIDLPVGRFAYCEDPDANSFGLFAMAG